MSWGQFWLLSAFLMLHASLTARDEGRRMVAYYVAALFSGFAIGRLT